MTGRGRTLLHEHLGAALKKVPAEHGCHARAQRSVPRTRQGSLSARSDTPVGRNLRARFWAAIRSLCARGMKVGLK